MQFTAVNFATKCATLYTTAANLQSVFGAFRSEDCRAQGNGEGVEAEGKGPETGARSNPGATWQGRITFGESFGSMANASLNRSSEDVESSVRGEEEADTSSSPVNCGGSIDGQLLLIGAIAAPTKERKGGIFYAAGETTTAAGGESSGKEKELSQETRAVDKIGEDAIRAQQAPVCGSEVGVIGEGREWNDAPPTDSGRMEGFDREEGHVDPGKKQEITHHDALVGGPQVVGGKTDERVSSEVGVGHPARNAKAEEFAAIRIQATSRRHAAYREVRSRRLDGRKRPAQNGMETDGLTNIGERRQLPRQEIEEESVANKTQSQGLYFQESRAASLSDATAFRGKQRSRGASVNDEEEEPESRRSPQNTPALAIDSPAGLTSVGIRKVASKIPREPLAILRQLRDYPETKSKPKSDQFMLRRTICSAIEAHVRKTGALRRKAQPLVTLPLWRPAKVSCAAQEKTLKKLRPVRNTSITKRRECSPLHRSVKEVNSSILAAKKLRAQSAEPSSVRNRLSSAIFGAERLGGREHLPEDWWGEGCMGGGSAADCFSEDEIHAPLPVRCRPPD